MIHEERKMKDDVVVFRIDEKSKQEAQKVAALYGLSLSSVLSSYLHEIASTGKIPLNLAIPAKKEENSDGILSFAFIKKVVATLASSFPSGSFKALYLFGSYARKEATLQSDIDILVVPGEKLDYFALGRLNESLREKFSRSVDTSLSTSMPPAILAQVEKEKILLYQEPVAQ
jgi:addiction module RelB/DinJ family antitoxin